MLPIATNRLPTAFSSAGYRLKEALESLKNDKLQLQFYKEMTETLLKTAGSLQLYNAFKVTSLSYQSDRIRRLFSAVLLYYCPIF